MSIEVILGIILILLSIIVACVLLLSNNNSSHSNFKSLSSQKNNNDNNLEDIDFVKVERTSNGKYTLRQKMIYANWKFPPILFNMFRFSLAILCFMIAKTYFKIFLSTIIAFLAFNFANGFLNRAIKKRFDAFDKDYPTFLQTIVSLLKSGMNVLTAIDSASEGLEDTSLLKSEVKVMMERLRAGVGEEKAIGNFGATIDHPEIELFIQTIILGKSLGGSLSMTLDRLAEQVRKRQYFRGSAVASIAQQKGSLWVILYLLSGLIITIGCKAPDLFAVGLHSNGGRMVLEIGICIILLGIFWIKKVINIKV
ncbi:MAG: type II secretion system F family protein [Bdellovibrionota bacterium]|nr:type II secretion system F family protein [Pseudomonadota bacterium]MDY6089982.1 type II secretion system F family protein [Bdellovibrionota bacterium]